MVGFPFLLGLICLCMHGQVDAGLPRSVIENAVRTAKARVDSLYESSRRMTIDRVRRSAAHPAEVLRLMKQPVGQYRTSVRYADYMDNALRLIKASQHKRGKRSINATDFIAEEDLNFLAQLTGCSPRARPPSCLTVPNVDVYRTASSVCNNRANPRWGASNIPFTRMAPAQYQDNIAEPKGWNSEEKINGYFLPLAREVSNRILKTPLDDVKDDPLFSFFLTIFAQLTDHDLTFTPHSPVTQSFNGGIDCTETCERREPCFPIEFPKNDPRLERSDDECMPFFRSASTCGSGRTGHNFGEATVRQQLNTLTAFIDAGHLYGSDDAKAIDLRDLTSDDGLLRVNSEFKDNDRELLPFAQMGVNMCATRARITGDRDAEEVPCFLAGDERSNENIALTSLHTLFLREHNRIARALRVKNPYWSGEKIYQETRKIIGAFFQIFMYRDFLFHILGPDVMAKKLSTYPGYDETVDPSITNVFATAAYRFAHVMVHPFIGRLDENYKEHSKFGSVLLHRAFFTPWRIIYEGGVDPILRGLVSRPAKLNTQDGIMTDELRDRLFELNEAVALDLSSLNIQRGRDHALPGYNTWRELCGLSTPKTVEELADVLQNKELAKHLLKLYGTPDNIDVWLGGVAEPFVRGGRVGPLFACLIATQFKKIRQGDRLWWENKGVFTEAQKRSLRDVSLARIICDNTGIKDVPTNVFQFRPRGSNYTNCDDIPMFDLGPWKEGKDYSEEGTKTPPKPWTPPNGYGIPGPRGPQGPQGERGPPGPPGKAVHVGFSFRLGNNFPRSGIPIAFKEKLINENNDYNIKTGIFTCAIPGVYEFGFHCQIFKNSASLDLMRNGKRLLHSYTTKHSGYDTASGSILVHLDKEDKVWLVANPGGNAITKDSIFFGHLLWGAS